MIGARVTIRVVPLPRRSLSDSLTLKRGFLSISGFMASWKYPRVPFQSLLWSVDVTAG